jgi:selenide,water dikinase
MGPGDLHQALRGLPQAKDPNLLTGFAHAEDAGVYKISPTLALVQTVDFFPPVVDDPYMFGQIAAANALSDVYAMGGRPLTALNLVAFPSDRLDLSVLREILRGGQDKVREAGAVIVGGHSIIDPEIKYGLAVTGLIHPRRVVENHTIKDGDDIILTKPLGTGIINTALKKGRALAASVKLAQQSMARLNRRAAEAMQAVGVHAATDVTGFGLLGHLGEMIGNAKLGILLNLAAIPLLPGTEALAVQGNIPGGAGRNRKYRGAMVQVSPRMPACILDILFDPQTSGGLLMAVAPERARRLLRALARRGETAAAVIGRVVKKPAGRIVVY